MDTTFCGPLHAPNDINCRENKSQFEKGLQIGYQANLCSRVELEASDAARATLRITSAVHFSCDHRH